MRMLLVGIGMLSSLSASDQEDRIRAKVRKLVKRGDLYYGKRSEPRMAGKAVESYQKALVLDDTVPEPYWKIARVQFWLGSNEKEDARKAKVYREAIDYCKMAIALNPKCLPAHFWLGVLYGLFGQAKGIFQSLDLIQPLKNEMEWVLQRDERFESAGAHRVLGRLYHQLPGIKGGDNDKAIAHLRKAVTLAPDLLDNHLFLAEVYRDEGRKAEAKKHLRIVLASDDHPAWVPESRRTKEIARKLLAEWEGK